MKQRFLWIVFAGFGMLGVVRPLFAAEEAFYDAYAKRDPFVPLYASGEGGSADLFAVNSADELTVEGIVYDPKGGSIVIVNGTVLKEGQQIGNVKVIRIEPRGVALSVNEIEEYKPLYEEK